MEPTCDKARFPTHTCIYVDGWVGGWVGGRVGEWVGWVDASVKCVRACDRNHPSTHNVQNRHHHQQQQQSQAPPHHPP
jgi:hypothetical protein